MAAVSPVAANHESFSFVVPASDNPCGVDILVDVEDRADRAPVGNADITFTNLETGATYGKLEYTLDGNDIATAFSLAGTYTDLCAELSS